MVGPDLIDGFRFLNNVHTQVRSLAICSQFIKSLGNSRIPRTSLKQILTDWSFKLEDTSEDYRRHNGKLTERKTKTRAFQRYLDFIVDLGLVTSVGNFVMNSRMGDLLAFWVNEKKDEQFYLTEEEKVFYFYLLFEKDGDGTVFVLDLLNEFSGRVSQSELTERFERLFKERLMVKQKNAIPNAQLEIREKYRAVEFQWKSAKKYSEHILVPRLEWLADLGVVDLLKEKGRVYYELKRNGYHLYKSLVTLPESGFRDINNDWIREFAAKEFSQLIFEKETLSDWKDYKETVRRGYLSPLLEETYKVFSRGGASRMSSYPTMLFIIINLICRRNVLIEFKELETELKKNIKVKDRVFSIRPAARINEEYITVTSE